MPAKRKQKAAKPSTALARRPKQAVVRHYPRQMTPIGEMAVAALQSLPDAPIMSLQHVGTLKLTKEQIEALRRPLATHEVEWKPAVKDGPPIIPYVAHTAARDRLDEAFGLGGWGCVPVGMPKTIDGLVLTPCALMVGGVPRFFKWGECEYKEANRNMSYGDALEGSISSAIVRCGKELGIGRELWSKNGRSKLTPPGQQPRVSQESSRRRDFGPPPEHHDAKGEEPITTKWKDKDGKWHAGQRERLWAIIKSSGRTEQEVKAWLAVRFDIDSTTKIKRKNYDEICKCLEAPGPLTDPGELAYEREPGQDDE